MRATLSRQTSSRVVRRWLPKTSIRMRTTSTIRRDMAVIDKPLRRSITVTILTGEPAVKTDRWGAKYTESVLVSGYVQRFGRKGLPIVDGGDTSTVRNIYGSVRNIRVSDGKLIGELSWASDNASQRAKSLYEDGHIIGNFQAFYHPLEVVDVPRGEKFGSVTGPAQVVTKYTPLSVSLLAE